MALRPTGTVTFLFTDLEGSTELVQLLGDHQYAQVLEEHARLLRAAFQAGEGHEIDNKGDGFLVAFQRARDAVTTAFQAQLALKANPWPRGTMMRVRMGLHTGEPIIAGDRYIGVDVHRAERICAAGHGGQILISQAACGLIEHDLPKDVGLRDLGSHRLKDLRRPERIFQVLHPDLPADFLPLRSLDEQTNNLPIQLSSFIGRNQEQAQLKRILSTTRLLTLTGPGGCGKTRLALQVAAESLEEFWRGVWFVDLAPVTDSAAVPQAIAFALHVKEQPNRPVLAAIIDYIGHKHLLLMLDNCEHLIDGCAHLAQTLLRACPSLRILATSREPLGIEGETTFSVPSLSMPDTGPHPSTQVVIQSEAVRLFVERAVAVRPDLALTDRNVHSVAEVCRFLDGIPLAIELAAARAKVLSIDQIVARLSDRFHLLTGGKRTASPRQQTLRAAVDWSYDLLTEAESKVFRRLAIFAGGWTLEDAEEIVGREGLKGDDILDILTRLVDKSLIVAEERPDGMRYRFLETVRQYAREKLLDSKEGESVTIAHRDWFLALAEDAAKALLTSGPFVLRSPVRHTADAAHWLDRLEAEHDNLRAALEWSLNQEADAEIALRMAAALVGFWTRRLYWNEGRAFLTAALAGQAKAPKPLVARALRAAGWLASRQHDGPSSKSYFDQARSLYEELGDEGGIANSLYGLGTTAFRQGDTDLAQSFFERCLEMWQRLGDKPAVVSGLKSLGSVAVEKGDAEVARALFEESLAIARQLGLKGDIPWLLIDLGGIARWRGNYLQAAVLYEESRALFQELGDKVGIAWVRENLGYVARHDGDYPQAADHFMESLVTFQELGQPWGTAQSIVGLAAVAESRGMAEYAAQLLGASMKILDSIGYMIDDRHEYDRTLTAIQSRLDEQVFAAAWAQGAAMTTDEAVEHALALPQHMAERPRTLASQEP